MFCAKCCSIYWKNVGFEIGQFLKEVKKKLVRSPGVGLQGCFCRRQRDKFEALKGWNFYRLIRQQVTGFSRNSG